MPMNMSDIARLAGVRRPVVSAWRSRYASGPHPFPAPLAHPGDHGGILFDEAAVVEWLEVTGRGNNPDAAVEQPLHTASLAELARHPDEASALLLLHHAAQAPLASLTSAELDEVLLLSELPLELVPPEWDLTSPVTAALLSHVDAVAEAAFSAEAALARLVESFATPNDAWGASTLSPSARALMSAVLTQVQTEADVPLVPASTGALALLAASLPHADSATDHPLIALPRLLRTAQERTAWRLLAARGHDITVLHTLDKLDDDAPLILPFGCLALAALSPGDAAAEELNDVLLAMHPADRALLLGPAALLTGPEERKNRHRLLTDAAASGISLRYSARLPKGLQTRSIRHRLALWVLAGPDAVPPTTEVVTADHADARLDAGAVQAIAADVAVVMTGDDAVIKAHAFRAGGRQPLQRVRGAVELTAPSRAAPLSPMGSDLLAVALNADPALVAALQPLAARASHGAVRVSWARLTSDYGSDRPGVRLPADELGDSGAGTVAVLGPDEVSGAAPRGARRIDRLRLEDVAPHARFTEPGDVVYVSAGGPAAVVDDVGGRVVLAPARVFRPRNPDPPDPQGMCAAAAVVARDIAAQRVPDKDAWRIRLTPRGRAGDVARLARVAGARRTELQGRLARLEEAEAALLEALTTGTARLATNMTDHDDHTAAEAAEAQEEW